MSQVGIVSTPGVRIEKPHPWLFNRVFFLPGLPIKSPVYNKACLNLLPPRTVPEKANISSSSLLRYRFIGLNLLFVAYLWLLQPIVLHRLVASTKSTQPDWLMGGLLLGIQAAEFFGLLLKRPLTTFFARLYPSHGGKVGSWDGL